MSIENVRTFILAVGWPVLIVGSVLIFVKGRKIYKLVKNSLVGKITKVLVYTMLVEMYSLGIVTTVYMYCQPKGVYLGLPIFLIWFAVFVMALRTLSSAQKETEKITGMQK